MHATFEILSDTKLMMIDEDDSNLLRRVTASRDEGAFRTLYQRHTPALYALAIRLLGASSAEAENAVQESWIRASGRLAAFRGDSSFRTWISGILVNACREVRRKREPTSCSDGFDPPGPITSEAVRIDLDRAISSLPEGYRDVVVLHDIEGYTHEEIGRLLDIDPGTSKSQLSRARRALRASLSSPPALREPRAGREGA